MVPVKVLWYTMICFVIQTCVLMWMDHVNDKLEKENLQLRQRLSRLEEPSGGDTHET